MKPNEVADGYYWLRAEGVRDKIDWTPVQVVSDAQMARSDRDKMVHFFNAEEITLSNLLAYSKVDLRPMIAPD